MKDGDFNVKIYDNSVTSPFNQFKKKEMSIALLENER